MSTLIILSDYSLNTPSRFTGPYVNPLTPPLINVITINFVFEYYDTTSVNFHKNSGIQNWTPSIMQLYNNNSKFVSANRVHVCRLLQDTKYLQMTRTD